MTTKIEAARAAAVMATEELAALEAEERAKAEADATKRAEAEREAAKRFLADLPALEERAKGERPTDEVKAEALKTGTLAALVADHLARRDAVSSLRDHAVNCARLIGSDRQFGEVRYVDPGDELRRWNEDAMTYLRRQTAADLADEILSAYEVA